MPRYIAIDWDAQGLRVVEAATRGGKATLSQTLTLAEPLCLAPADAQAAGQRLKEQLKKAKIAPGPALVCVGRDRAVFRDVRYPDVPPDEAPDIVHFQTVKELTFPADEAVIDYQATSIPFASGEKRALVIVLRKEVLTAVKKLCAAAGLKLESLNIRPFGLAANCLAQNAPNAGETVAALVLSNGVGELCIFRDRELLFSRSLALGESGPTGLVPELRRSLASFDSQFPAHVVTRVFVTGLEWPTDVDTLATGIRLPVFLYAPTGAGKTSPDDGVEYAGAFGLVQERAAGKPAVNLATPKQSAPPSNTPKYYWAAGVAAAALVLIGIGVTYGAISSARSTKIKELQDQKATLKKETEVASELDKRLEAIHQWSHTEMVMLDELYDLVARFPDLAGLRITAKWTTLAQQPAPAAKTVTAAKPGAVAKKPQGPLPIGEIEIMATADRPEALLTLKAALQSSHWKPDVYDESVGTNQARLVIKVYRQKPEEYHAVLSRGENVTGPVSGGGERRGPGGNRARFPTGNSPLRPPEGGRP